MSEFTAEKLRRAAEKSAIRLRVFLAGPFIQAKGPTPSASENNGATLLRFELFKFLSEALLADVTLGEHQELQEIYREHFKGQANAALAELAHVDTQVDFVVLIPSSPGSFSELGLFSLKNTICQKMLILLDASKKEPPGFVHLGPVSFAKHYGSTAEYIDYADIDSAKQIVQGFFERIKIDKLASRYRL